MMIRVITMTALVGMGFVQPAETGAGRRGGAQPAGDRTQMIVDRLMRADTDGDGKVSKDEFPERFRDQIFGTADADGDGYLTREELSAHFENNQPAWGPGNRGREGAGEGREPAERGAGRGAEAQPSFDGGMQQMGRSMRSLRRSEFNAASMDDDLELIGELQMGIVRAKSQIEHVVMSDAAKAEYGMDHAAYMKAFRLEMLEALEASTKLEEAVLEGKSADAKKYVEELMDVQRDGHRRFEHDD